MRKNTKQIGTNLTPDQIAAVKVLATADGGIAQYLLRLIREDAQRRGIEWPASVGRGKYARKK